MQIVDTIKGSLLSNNSNAVEVTNEITFIPNWFSIIFRLLILVSIVGWKLRIKK